MEEVYRCIKINDLLCDAAVAPQYIRFPQNVSLLNEARVQLEKMICYICETYQGRLISPEYISVSLIRSILSLQKPKGRLWRRSAVLPKDS